MPCDSCGVDFVLPENFEVFCDIITKDCGAERVYAHLCDYGIDTLDQTTLDAAVTAEKLRTLPLGNLTITSSTGSPIKISCNKEIPGKTVYTMTFTSASRGESNEDFVYWDSMYRRKLNLSLAWKSCDGLWFLNPQWADWVTAGSIAGDEPDAPFGYEVSFTQAPILVRDEANEICSWTMSWQFKYNGVLVAVPLPTITL